MSRLPAVRTTVVGSYPVPEWLRVYPTQPHLRDATLVVLKTQELAGIDVIADGELYRFDVNHPETNGMIDFFIGQMEGISTRLSVRERRRFQQDPNLHYRTEPAGVVRGPIGPGVLDLERHYRRVRELTDRPLKFTLTGPHMLSKVLLDDYYGDRAAVAMALADVLREQVQTIDAGVVQLDEANITGHPEEGEWAAAAINRVLEAIPGEKAVHLCFGNYGGQTVQKGEYARLLPFMNRLAADHLVLEFARRGYQELEVLRDLDARIRLGIGVIDIKDNGIESPETVARRIEHAAEVLGQERLAYVHPDCGFWMLPRNVADGKMVALVQGRDLFLGAD